MNFKIIFHFLSLLLTGDSENSGCSPAAVAAGDDTGAGASK